MLVSVSQFTELKLLFYSSKFHTPLRSRDYEFIRVEYLDNARPGEKWPVGNLYGRPQQSQWEIAVQPVPRVFRRRIKEYIVDSALPISSRSQLPEERLNSLHEHEESVRMIRKIYESVAQVEVSRLLIFGIDDNGQRRDVPAVE